VILVLGLSLTLLIARALHRHAEEVAESSDQGRSAEPATKADQGNADETASQRAAASPEQQAQDQERFLAEFRTDHSAPAAGGVRQEDLPRAEVVDVPIYQAPAGSAPQPLPAARSAVLPPVGQPPVPAGVAQAQAAPAGANALGLYVVAAGDNPWKISARIFGDGRHAQKIVDANPGLNPARLQIGQKLRIPALPGLTPRIQLQDAPAAAVTPAAFAGPATAAAGSAPVAQVRSPAANQAAMLPPIGSLAQPPVPPAGVAAHPASPAPLPASALGLQPSAPTLAAASQTHTIQPGDTLEKIARRFYGVAGPRTVKRITDANPGVDPMRLQIGTTLTIPAQQ
jgi:nucleoid-associated protein YgaU